MTGLTRAALAADLAGHAFGAPVHASLAPRRIGAEAEFIPVESGTGRRCPIEADGLISTLPFLRRFGADHGWRESRTPKGTPCFLDRKSTRLNSSHLVISYAVFCLKKKKNISNSNDQSSHVSVHDNCYSEQYPAHTDKTLTI